MQFYNINDSLQRHYYVSEYIKKNKILHRYNNRNLFNVEYQRYMNIFASQIILPSSISRFFYRIFDRIYELSWGKTFDSELILISSQNNWTLKTRPVLTNFWYLIIKGKDSNLATKEISFACDIFIACKTILLTRSDKVPYRYSFSKAIKLRLFHTWNRRKFTQYIDRELN